MERSFSEARSSNVSRGNMERIIRDIFRGEKAGNIILGKIITEENACVTNVDNEIKEIYEGHKTRTKDIKKVEQKLMQNQIKPFKQEKVKYITKGCTSKDAKELVNQEDIEKYKLIHKDEVFSTEKQQASKISLTEEDSYHTRGEEIREMFMEQKVLTLPHRKTVDYAFPETKDECKSLDKVQFSEQSKESSKRMTAEVCDILRAYPPSVCFADYEVGRLKEESIFIQNMSNRVVKFNVRPLKDSSRFKISWIPLPGYTKMIAPGIRMKIKVAFEANCLADEEDCLTIVADDGSILTITLEAKRNSTFLKVIDSNPAAGPSIVDCGECLLGDINTITLQLCNCGRDARFWINNELTWPLWESLNLSSKTELATYPFKISPQYFNVKHGAVIKVSFSFEPKMAGLFSQKLYILCDNCSIQELEIKGSGCYFNSHYLVMQDIKKNTHFDKSYDMMAQYCFNMPKCLVAKKVSKLFTVANTSGINLQFSWKKRNVNLISIPSDNLHGLQDTAVSIEPETGTFKAHTEQDFLVNCRATNLEVGMYKTVLQLYIENLPNNALPSQENADSFTIVMDKFVSDKLVQVLVHEVELCLEVEPYRITIEPSIIQFHGKIRCTDKPLKRTVVVHNHGANSVMVEWQNSTTVRKEGLCCNLVMRPSKIKNCYPHYSFRLTICPAAPGKVVEKLRLIIDNGAKILELMIKLEIFGQIISLSTNVLNFGLVKRGTLIKKTFSIINHSQLRTTWRIKEYIYNASKQILEMDSNSHVSASSGYVDKKHRFNDIVYYLNTMIPGIWCSVLELTLNASEENECIKEYALVIADIVMPKLMINVMPGKDNTLQLFCPLYLGIESKRTVKMYNLTNLPTSFSWAEPVGCDSHKLRVTISPQEHIIQAATSVSVGINILPLDTGSVRHFFVPCIVEKTNELLLLSIQLNVENVHVTFFVPSANSVAAESEDSETDAFFIQIPWPFKHEIPLEQNDSIEGKYSSGLHYLDVCRCPIPAIPEKETFSTEEDVIQKIPKEVDVKLQNSPLDVNIPQYNQPCGTEELKYEDKTIIAPSSLKSDSMEELADLKITETKDGPLIHIPGVEGIPSVDFIPAFPLAAVNRSETENQNGRKQHKRTKDKRILEGEKNKIKIDSKKDAKEQKDELKKIKKKKNAQVKIGSNEKNKTLMSSLNENKKNKGKKLKHGGKTTLKEHELMNPDSDLAFEINYTGIIPNKKENGSDINRISDALLPVTSGIQYALPPEIAFNQLSCHKVFKKSFAVKNETPIATHFSIKIQNFAQKEESFPEDRSANENCQNTVDKLHTYIKSGIIVSTNPTSAKLLAYDTITVEVLIYATTWGSYTDYIHCKISPLSPFIIKLSIEVTGFPLFFPMAKNSDGEGELRFGTTTWQGVQKVRRIRICNTSSINIFLTWHVFLLEENCLDNSLQLLMEINKFSDIHFLPPNDPHKIEKHRMLMACFCNKCDDWRESIGLGMIPLKWKEDFEMFQVEPKEMIVPPGSSRFIKVKLNPCVANDFIETNVINAVATGLIHLNSQDREQKDFYRRQIWPYQQPVILKLSTNIENPLYKLHVLQGKCHFQACACDILTAQKTHTINQLFVLCYHGKAPTIMEVTVSKPFRINKIATINLTNEKTSCFNQSEIMLTEGMIVELELDCTLDLSHVRQGYMWLKHSSSYLKPVSSNSITLYRYLTFTPRSYSAQEMQLEVTIYYPNIYITPQKVDFGPVFLGTTKGLSFTIENRSGFSIWVYLKKHCESCIFTVTPSPLFIPCTSVGDVGVSDVQVNFTPSQAMSYQEVLSVETLIPGDVHDILLMGCGALNEKFNKQKQ